MTTAHQDADTAPPRDLTDVAELRQRAQDFVRDYIAENKKEPTGELVGKKFGMKERWGRNQIDAVRIANSGTAPARRSGTGGTARRTVGEAVAARESTAAGTDGPVTLTVGADRPARTGASAPARQTSPPARTGTTTGTAAAQPAAPSGTAAARRSGTDDRAETGHDAAGGKLVAWLGFAFGSVVSILANVMHAWTPIPPENLSDVALAAWVPPVIPDPSVSSQIAAGIWPAMLLVAVEVMTRVPWASAWYWAAARYGGVGAVGLGSAIISYGHIKDVLRAWHYGDFSAHIGPLVVDGLMVISGFALLSISQAARGGSRS